MECTYCVYGRSSGERARRVSTHRKHKQPCLELINANGLVRDAVERQRVHPYANPRPHATVSLIKGANAHPRSSVDFGPILRHYLTLPSEGANATAVECPFSISL